jgi:UDP-glucose 4-epimerase
LKIFIAGGAGFIGSHLVEDILAENKDFKVVVYDNFSSGRKNYLERVKKNYNLEIVQADVKDLVTLSRVMKKVDLVYHLASNPDIARSVRQPDIDFWEGTYLTNNILEAMRANGVKKIIYPSGSGVYGDIGKKEVAEDYSPLRPISTYGASKLACESLLSAYCHMFGMTASVFRFANVVGPRQTHGVGYDFIRKLGKNPRRLEILGDGRQSKSYIYVDDVIRAMRLVERKQKNGFDCYNVATLDYLTVTEIARIVVEIMGLREVKFEYTGGQRGWKGDVPVVRLNSEKIRKLGWKNQYNSREAMIKAVEALIREN